MKKKFLLLSFFIPYSFSLAQEDQITEMLDSLEGLYFFKELKVTENNSNYPKNFVPKFDDQTYDARLKEMASNSPFNYVYNYTVKSYIDRYTKNPKSASTILALSKLYFPLYEKYLNQYKIPLELKYLSVVESALNPTAKSHCGASGLWQFMYGTGKVYNLEINSYVDERFDPEKETIAACRYLRDLYSIYKDWSLAIAAYNCGPGNVNKAIKRAGKRDFWDIREYLPKETQNYVPAFIAASYIMTYHEEHNMSVANIKFLYDDLDFITINKKTSLSNISYLLGIPLAELKYLNPKYFMGVIPGNNDKVILSKEKALAWIDYENEYLGGSSSPKKKTTEPKKKTSTTNTFVEPNNNVAKTKQPTEKKEIDPFGTITNTSVESVEIPASDVPANINSDDGITENSSTIKDSTLANEEDQNFIVLCEVYGNQTLSNNSTILIRNTELIMIDEEYIIPINSIIKGRVVFKDNSIFIKTLSAKTITGDVRFVSETEIREKLNGKKIIIEDGYTVFLKF